MARKHEPAKPALGCACPENRPEPPVPSDADLRRFPGMMVNVSTFRDSSITATPNAAAFRCSVLSWFASWHQVPAGSLPNDERMIAHLCGCSLKTFRAAWAQGGKEGWWEASDGRLYHPDVTETVLAALENRRSATARTASATEAAATRRKADENAITGTSNPHDDYMKRAPHPLEFRQHIENKRAGLSVTDAREGKGRENKNQQACADFVPASGAQAAEECTDRARMPRLNDPEHKWCVLSGGQFALDEQGRRHPLIAGKFIDQLCEAVCQAAGILDPGWRGDWWVVIRWVHAGIKGSQMVDAIKQRAARPGYSPPASLRYFDPVVREFAARQEAEKQRRAAA